MMISVKVPHESRGFKWMIRSVASHTPIDLLASNSSEAIAIQVKARPMLAYKKYTTKKYFFL